MDFTKSSSPCNIYTRHNPELLPPFYLVYNTEAGGDSGQVHSTVRERFDKGDQAVIDGMQQLGCLADEAVTALYNRDYRLLSSLMNRNFALRRSMYGDDVVGSKNLRAITLAQECGFGAKFTGSGGSIICLHETAENGWLSDEEESKIKGLFESIHFAFVRVCLPSC